MLLRSLLIKKTLLLILLVWSVFGFSYSAQAGGTDETVKVLNTQNTEAGQELLLHKQNLSDTCQKFTVIVNYARVPWYSWAPFVSSTHPSFSETQTALKALQTYQKNQKVFRFGSMSGLKEIGACTFESKGLKITAKDQIYSFYYPL